MDAKPKKRKPNKGGFKKGNQAAKGKGRPPKVAELKEAEMLRDVFDKAKLRRILGVIYNRALDGDRYCIAHVVDWFFPAGYMADKLAGEGTDALTSILADLKAEYKESDG